MGQIALYPEPVLLKRAEEVTDHREGQQIADKLLEAMRDAGWGEAVGMAAPQIGVSKRVFVTRTETFINPKVVWLPTGGWRWFDEGCYSLEKERFNYRVRRPWAITLQWTDYTGIPRQQMFTGHDAEIIHHEFEHLEGLLANQNEIC